MATKNSKTLQVSIISRFLEEKDLKSFLQQYNENSHHTSVIREPDERDVKLANLVKKHQSISRAAKEVGVSTYRVFSALSRVTAHKK